MIIATSSFLATIPSYHNSLFPIAHNTLCLPPKFCINYCFGDMQSSQENLKTIVYAKFGGQTRCIMGNWKIENERSSQAAKYTGTGDESGEQSGIPPFR